MKTWRRGWVWLKRRSKRLIRKCTRAVIIHWWLRVVLSAFAASVVYETLPGGDARLFLATLAGGVTFLLFSWWLILPAVVLLTYVALSLVYADSMGQHGILARLMYPAVVCGMLVGVPPFVAALFRDRRPFWKRWRDRNSG